MSEQDAIVEYRLDSIVQGTRFVAGAGPKLATRIALGAVLAVEDSAVDPAGELLGIKVVSGAKSIAAACGSIARAAGSKVTSAASSVKEAVGTSMERVASTEPGAIQGASVVTKTQALVGRAASELAQSWQDAGHVYVRVADEVEPVVSQSQE